MPLLADLVFENSDSTGTGNLTIARAGGHQRVSEAFGTGDNGVNNPVLFIVNTEASAAEWEIAQCYMSDANTLVRGTPIRSSNSDAAVNFGAGVKTITNDIPASMQSALESWGNWTGAIGVTESWGNWT
jgi:hypothetical protein